MKSKMSIMKKRVNGRYTKQEKVHEYIAIETI